MKIQTTDSFYDCQIDIYNRDGVLFYVGTGLVHNNRANVNTETIVSDHYKCPTDWREMYIRIASNNLNYHTPAAWGLDIDWNDEHNTGYEQLFHIHCGGCGRYRNCLQFNYSDLRCYTCCKKPHKEFKTVYRWEILDI